MKNYVIDDAAFAAFAAKSEADKKAAQNRQVGGYAPREYEQTKWCGLETGETKIVRIVGAPPESMTPGLKANDFAAKELFFSKIVDDHGKNMQLRLPVHADDFKDEHIMWKIISAVKEVSWVPDPTSAQKKNKKIFKHEGKPYFDKVVHGGFDPVKQDFAFRTSKGWGGQQVVVMNVIDREDNWCAENKHTKLLSKKIGTSVNAEGEILEWPEVGVPSYGFLGKISELIGKYGSWEKYDIAIDKTGEMTAPYNVKNATAFVAAGMTAEIGPKSSFVSSNATLTEEELSWDRYDLNKLYSPTSYNKILKQLGNTIKAIDADLNKQFFQELQALADKEAAEWAAKREAAAESTPTEAPLTEATAPEATSKVERTVAREAAPIAETTIDVSLLKGWEGLTPEERTQITGTKLNADGSLASVSYSENSSPLLSCTIDEGGCGFEAPRDFTSCPVCGLKYL